ncbi:MAG: 2-C-methyl-D-erythritol 4-phosphate cytidylyltransferase [Clostridium sp.]|nr:2-C-methyl-D-erythritol 4-phosphate cytidylyltransferase [Prevotella sp.]MCM1429478.1 2-C-methyl-D-erythritol 4-phosphate cytidylyltransferase [Clostridium sp.]MCM1476225.1 2-C-methyl-D-erythritol 4-phosphate cytidylyltransferase [Muribaculaceae bacterium]
MQKVAIILAGGVGQRAGGDVPKQLRQLKGRPVLWWSIHRFMLSDPSTSIIIVMHPGLYDDWDASLNSLPSEERYSHILCPGGKTRTESVGNAMGILKEILESEKVPAEEMKVAVHDGARPCVSLRIIEEGWDTCESGIVAVPAIRPTSSLRRLTSIGSEAVDRSEYREVQTPQTATAKELIEAYTDLPEGEFTDDASLLQQCGTRVRLYEGSTENIKITYPQDFKIAEYIIDA